MPRKKLKEEEKKKDISISMNIKLNEMLEEYLIEKGVNKSRYIEHLIKKDLENKKLL